jgi:hypothetical protein
MDATVDRARAEVQRALGLARLANDPDLKQQWLAVADSWSALIAAIERHASTRREESEKNRSLRPRNPGQTTTDS